MYVPLHSHSEFSISDGLFNPKKWAEAYKDLGFKAAALTDHGTLAGLLAFYHAMKNNDLIPIMGCEFYYVDKPEIKTADNRKANHLILLAKDYSGFQNLLKLSKLAAIEGFFYKPRIGMEWLSKYHEGLVCLTACQGGVLANEVWRERKGETSIGLKKRFEMFQKIFGDDFYVEFQGHTTPVKIEDEEFDSQVMINQALYGLRDLPGFQPIATNDNHYIIQEHSKIQEHLKRMAWKNTEAGQSYTHCDSLWLKNSKQVYEAFRRNHEFFPKEFVASALKNTEAVFEKTRHFELPTKKYLPAYRPKVDSRDFFKKLTIAKFKEFALSVKKEQLGVYIARFKKEFGVISKFNLEDYFLIVWDICRYASERGIYVGIGRGSSAGSLISYLLGIVKLDPLRYGLIFERFLNENRCLTGELPDIDLDFESDHRDEIKDYIFKTYGRDNVCEIGTYGRMKLKTSIIDFGKALGVANQKDLLAITTKLNLDKEDANDLEAALKSDSRLLSLMASNDEYAFCVSEIIGQVKSQGVHPAGMIICSEPVADITPVKSQKSGDDRILVTAAEDKYVIAQGLMKMDLLGLKEYDVIRYVLENDPNFAGFDANNYLKKIFDEPSEKVWDLFQQGETDGVFQFASSGMKQLLQQMVPEAIEDLMAANALFRPGCLENGWHIQYCDRKSGREEVEYPHKIIKEITRDTYGIYVYQEQFIEALHKLGDISLADSDTIRSALGKKNKEKLESFKAEFVAGATPKIGATEASDLWDQLEKASGYSFNRSHSAAYSVLAYVSQYLKAYSPAYFWAAQLDWDTRKNKLDDMLVNRRAASRMGVGFVTPHINSSKVRFTVDSEQRVVWSFSSVKGVGPKAAEELQRCQPYVDFDDFYERVNKSKVKHNNIEALIFAGAFDAMGDRRDLLSDLFDKRAAKKKGKETVKKVSHSEESMVMAFQKSMGFFEQKIKRLREFPKSCITEEDLREYSAGEWVLVGGMLSGVRTVKTKNGESMGFASLMDLDEIIDLTIFPKSFAKYRSVIREGNIVLIGGEKSGYGGKENAIEVQTIEKK